MAKVAGAIEVGDIVLVHSEMQPRGLWKLGKVQSLKHGADCQTRSATVRVHSKELDPPCTSVLSIDFTHWKPTADLTMNRTRKKEKVNQTELATRSSQRAAASITRDQLKALEYV